MKTVLLVDAQEGRNAKLAVRYLEEGYDIASLSLADEVRERAKEKGRKAILLNADKEKEDSVRDAVMSLKKEFDHLDVLIVNGFRVEKGGFEEIDAAAFKRIADENLMPLVNFVKPCSDWMIETKTPGRIVVENVDAAFAAKGDAIALSAVAMGMRGTTRAIARQLASKDIKVNAYCLDEGQTKDGTGLAYYLGSETNVNMTGQNILVDGGAVMD